MGEDIWKLLVNKGLMSRIYIKKFLHTISKPQAEDMIRHFSKEHTDSKQTHEKMFSISNHQVNANQNHNEISPHSYFVMNTIMTKMKNN